MILHVTSLKAPICACRQRHCMLKQVVKAPCRPQHTSARALLYLGVTPRQCRQMFGCASVSPGNSSGTSSLWDGVTSPNPKHLGGASKGFATPLITSV